MKLPVQKLLLLHTLPIAFLLLSTHFGHCYYNTSTGRWLSRDPIGERGGENLYGFVYQRPIDLVDVVGLDDRPTEPHPTYPGIQTAPFPTSYPLPAPAAEVRPISRLPGSPSLPGNVGTPLPAPPKGTPSGGVGAGPQGLLLVLNTCTRRMNKATIEQAVDRARKECEALMAKRPDGKKCCAVRWCYQCGCNTGILNKLDRVGLGLMDMSCDDLQAKGTIGAGCPDKHDKSLNTYDGMQKP